MRRHDAPFGTIFADSICSNRAAFREEGGFGAGHSLGGLLGLTAVFDQRISDRLQLPGLDSYVDYMNGNIKGWTSDRYIPVTQLSGSADGNPVRFHEMIGALAACLPVKCSTRRHKLQYHSVDEIVKGSVTNLSTLRPLKKPPCRTSRLRP
jgi:hypothetical protein